MADVLIRGIEMPKDHSLWLVIRPDGMVFKIKNNDKPDAPKEGTAIFLPKGHGRCIDADALYEVAKTRSMGIYGPCNAQCIITGDDILKAHTIVPAEGRLMNE